MQTDSASITMYALDTHAPSTVVEVYINRILRGKIKVGQQENYLIQPGMNAVHVVVKSSIGPLISDPIVIKEVKAGEKFTFFAGPKISPGKMAMGAGKSSALSAIFGIFSIFFASKSDYQGNDSITFGQLAAGEDIDSILELARAQKRRTFLKSVVGFSILGTIFLLFALINLTIPRQKADVSLIMAGGGLFFLLLAYGAYRRLPTTNLPSPESDPASTSLAEVSNKENS